MMTHVSYNILLRMNLLPSLLIIRLFNKDLVLIRMRVEIKYCLLYAR